MGVGGKKSCANIILRDIEGNVIEAVLWDDYCKQFKNYNTPGKMAGLTIIVLTHPWFKPNTCFYNIFIISIDVLAPYLLLPFIILKIYYSVS